MPLMRLVVQEVKFLRRHSCGWLLTLAWKTTGHVSELQIHKCHRCHRGHLWNCHKIWSSLCALRCCNTFPREQGVILWCGRSSHSASAGWVDSISEDTLLLRYSQIRKCPVFANHNSWISVSVKPFHCRGSSRKSLEQESRGLTSVLALSPICCVTLDMSHDLCEHQFPYFV